MVMEETKEIFSRIQQAMEQFSSQFESRVKTLLLQLTENLRKLKESKEDVAAAQAYSEKLLFIFRRTLNDLLTAWSLTESEETCLNIKELLKLVFWCARKGVISVKEALVFSEDFCDILSVNDLRTFIDTFEHSFLSVSTLTDFDINYPLKICNMIFKKLTRTYDTLLRGKLHIFLSKILPLCHASGFKSKICTETTANIENIQIQQQQSSESSEMDIEEDKTAQTANLSYPNVEFYKKFWTLQKYFQDPSQLSTQEDPSESESTPAQPAPTPVSNSAVEEEVEEGEEKTEVNNVPAEISKFVEVRKVKAVCAAIIQVLERFTLNPVTEKRGTTIKPYLKFLTTYSLLEKQLDDPFFRKIWLLQALIFLSTIQNKTKDIEIKNIDAEFPLLKSTEDKVKKVFVQLHHHLKEDFSQDKLELFFADEKIWVERKEILQRPVKDEKHSFKNPCEKLKEMMQCQHETVLAQSEGRQLNESMQLDGHKMLISKHFPQSEALKKKVIQECRSAGGNAVFEESGLKQILKKQMIFPIRVDPIQKSVGFYISQVIAEMKESPSEKKVDNPTFALKALRSYSRQNLCWMDREADHLKTLEDFAHEICKLDGIKIIPVSDKEQEEPLENPQETTSSNTNAEATEGSNNKKHTEKQSNEQKQSNSQPEIIISEETTSVKQQEKQKIDTQIGNNSTSTIPPAQQQQQTSGLVTLKANIEQAPAKSSSSANPKVEKSTSGSQKTTDEKVGSTSSKVQAESIIPSSKSQAPAASGAEEKSAKRIQEEKNQPKQEDTPSNVEHSDRSQRGGKGFEDKQSRDSRDGGKDGRSGMRNNTSDTRDAESQLNKQPRDIKDTRESSNSKDNNNNKDNGRNGGDTRDMRDTRNQRESRDLRDSKDSRDLRDNDTTRDSRESRDSKYSSKPATTQNRIGGTEDPKDTSSSGSSKFQSNNSSQPQTSASGKSEEKSQSRQSKEDTRSDRHDVRSIREQLPARDSRDNRRDDLRDTRGNREERNTDNRDISREDNRRNSNFDERSRKQDTQVEDQTPQITNKSPLKVPNSSASTVSTLSQRIEQKSNDETGNRTSNAVNAAATDGAVSKPSLKVLKKPMESQPSSSQNIPSMSSNNNISSKDNHSHKSHDRDAKKSNSNEKHRGGNNSSSSNNNGDGSSSGGYNNNGGSHMKREDKGGRDGSNNNNSGNYRDSSNYKDSQNYQGSSSSNKRDYSGNNNNNYNNNNNSNNQGGGRDIYEKKNYSNSGGSNSNNYYQNGSSGSSSRSNNYDNGPYKKQKN